MIRSSSIRPQWGMECNISQVWCSLPFKLITMNSVSWTDADCQRLKTEQLENVVSVASDRKGDAQPVSVDTHFTYLDLGQNNSTSENRYNRRGTTRGAHLLAQDREFSCGISTETTHYSHGEAEKNVLIPRPHKIPNSRALLVEFHTLQLVKLGARNHTQQNSQGMSFKTID